MERELTPLADSQMALTRRIAEARAAITRSEESVPELQGQLERATARLDILGRVQSQHEGFDDGVRASPHRRRTHPARDETSRAEQPAGRPGDCSAAGSCFGRTGKGD